MIAMADTGDLLLFRGKHFASAMARGFTNSHFDHAALILKFDASATDMFFIECTGKYGVAINKWANIRKYIGSFYE